MAIEDLYVNIIKVGLWAKARIVMKKFTDDAHWRDTARDPKLWIFDYYATFPIVIMLFHITWTTFFIAVGAMLFFSLVKHYGFSVPVFFRAIRSTLAGKRKLAMPWWM